MTEKQLPEVSTVTFDAIRRQVDRDYAEKWFAREAMRFFGTRLPRTGLVGPGGTYFVTSEQPPNVARGFTVRVLVNGRIESMGDVASYQTRALAEMTARTLAVHGPIRLVRNTIDLARAEILASDEIESRVRGAERMLASFERELANQGQGMAPIAHCRVIHREASRFADGFSNDSVFRTTFFRIGRAALDAEGALTR